MDGSDGSGHLVQLGADRLIRAGISSSRGRHRIPPGEDDELRWRRYGPTVHFADPASESPGIERLIRFFASVPPLLHDTVLAAVLTATLLTDLTRSENPAGSPIRAPDPLGYLLVALLVLPLALRRRFPRAVFMVILVDATLTMALFYRPTSFGFGLIIATYTVARWCNPQTSVIAFVLAEGFGIAIKVRALAAGIDVGWFGWPLDAVYLGAAWFLGYTIRSRQGYARALERSREALARRAVQDERTRIARELHDAIGRSVSVMLLHTGAAEQLLHRDPVKAEQALQSVGEVGRAALGEMDQLLGLLRDDELEPDILRPSLANLDGLVAEFERLGLDIELDVSGELTPLPTALDQSAFRIVQEALTNTLKHAGPTRVEVTVARDGRDLSLDIRDHGQVRTPTTVAAVDHDHRGIVGMSERAAILDGSLEVGPCPDDGFLVTARLPLTRGRST